METIRSDREAAAATKLDPAEVCTLSGDGLAERLAWIRDEILPHVRRTERLASGLAWELDAAPGLAEKLDRLIALERECCGGVVFERTEASAAGLLRLEVRGIDPDAAAFRALHVARQREETRMGHPFAEIAFTPAVQARQQARGSRASYARFAEGEPRNDRLGQKEIDFIQARDGFYLASVSETGWPYVQFRGGPPGFLRVLDERTLGWADFRGNRQYVSAGNLDGDERVALILMDYANRRRLKLLGRAELREVGADEGLAARLAVPGYEAVVERAVLVRVAGFDWNCPQHITPRFTLAEIEQAVTPLRERVAELEAKLASCEANAG
jgi:hypothetical protein